MYNDIERTEEYKRRLLAFILCEYGIEAVGIASASRGFYGETWRLDAAGASYFLKLVYPAAHKYKYERSFPIVQHLCDHGINFISRIVKAADGRLSVQFDGAVLGVFDWIDGENVQNEISKTIEYRMLAKVYTVAPGGISIHSEDFMGVSAVRFYEQWGSLRDRELCLLLEKNRAKIEHRAARLKNFSEICRGDVSDFYITHGDAGGNVLQDGEKYSLVDWDYPVFTSVERDAWFCMAWDWAMAAFRKSLDDNGIGYALRPERLAYYCYDFFFYYLNAFLDARSKAGVVEEYIDGWIEESFRYADENL